VNVTDELPYNLLDFEQQSGTSIGFLSTVHVSDIWNKVTIKPSFTEPDHVWTANLIVSDL
jgi:hypothetical protein